MTEGVWVAIIAGVPSVLALIVSNRGRQHARAARVQVENNHDTNLREEGDERHVSLVALLMGTKSDVRGVRRDVGRLADRVEILDRKLSALDDRVDDIEDTVEVKP